MDYSMILKNNVAFMNCKDLVKVIHLYSLAKSSIPESTGLILIVY